MYILWRIRDRPQTACWNWSAYDKSSTVLLSSSGSLEKSLFFCFAVYITQKYDVLKPEPTLTRKGSLKFSTWLNWVCAIRISTLSWIKNIRMFRQLRHGVKWMFWLRNNLQMFIESQLNSIRIKIPTTESMKAFCAGLWRLRNWYQKLCLANHRKCESDYLSASTEFNILLIFHINFFQLSNLLFIYQCNWIVQTDDINWISFSKIFNKWFQNSFSYNICRLFEKDIVYVNIVCTRWFICIFIYCERSGSFLMNNKK